MSACVHLLQLGHPGLPMGTLNRLRRPPILDISPSHLTRAALSLGVLEE